jgi:hypothetical protein
MIEDIGFGESSQSCSVQIIAIFTNNVAGYGPGIPPRLRTAVARAPQQGAYE